MKARLSVQGLDKEVIDRFKEYVRKKHDKLHTVLGLEIEKAMREYLEREGYSDIDTHTHTHTHKPKAHKPKGYKKAGPQNEEDRRNLIYASYNDSGGNDGESEVEKLSDPKEPGIPPSERTKRRIIQHLKKNGMLGAEKINENAVRRVIGIEAGYDSRTINKYFNILEDELLLPHIEYVNIRDSRKLW